MKKHDRQKIHKRNIFFGNIIYFFMAVNIFLRILVKVFVKKNCRSW